ncbi:hypothetical protein DFH28DRAFT_830178, partial [Melampsora americana]
NLTTVNNSRPHHDMDQGDSQAVNPSANSPISNLPSPPAGGCYPSRAAAEIFLKNFASTHHYALSSLDSKPRLVKWKCVQGPNQKQQLAAAKDPTISIPTCPFQVSAKYVSTDTSWTIIIINHNHDHGPIPNLKPPKLPSLTSMLPKKRKQ